MKESTRVQYVFSIKYFLSIKNYLISKKYNMFSIKCFTVKLTPQTACNSLSQTPNLPLKFMTPMSKYTHRFDGI